MSNKKGLTMAHSLRCRLKELWRRGMLKDGDLERIVIIPKDATDGDVIMAMFGGMQINDPENENDLVYIEHLYFGFPKYWWDAPYKGGE